MALREVDRSRTKVPTFTGNAEAGSRVKLLEGGGSVFPIWPSEIPVAPVGPARFLRRNAHARLREALEAENGAVIAAAKSGFGKRTFIAEFARDAIQRYPGGIFWLDGRESHLQEMASDIALRAGGSYLNWPW